jgi:hypothetical protein
MIDGGSIPMIADFTEFDALTNLLLGLGITDRF